MRAYIFTILSCVVLTIISALLHTDLTLTILIFILVRLEQGLDVLRNLPHSHS